MSYCGICNNHNVTFTRVKGGYHCSGCDEIQYDDDLEKDIAYNTLIAATMAKREGWIIYPNWPGIGEPIDEVIAKYEGKCRALGIKI